MNYKSERSKACDIPRAVKNAVWARDRLRCVLCGDSRAMPNAHYISRAEGGLGVEKNIVTLCRECHNQYDQSTSRAAIREEIRNYLVGKYGDEWREEDLYFRRFNKLARK